MKDAPDRTRKLENNIYKYYIAMFFRNLWITMPIHIIYFLDRGLTFFQMGVMEAIIGGVVIISDVPSGAFADIFGRKLSTGLGMFLWGAGLIIIGMSTEFGVYLIASVMWGLSDSLISGAEKALFYDTLKELDQEDQYIKYIGKRDVITSMAVIASAILGGILYTINISFPFYAHGAASIVACGFIFSMKEPTTMTRSKTMKAQYRLIVESLHFTWKSKIVRFFTLFYIIVLMVPMVFVNLIEQFYLVEIGIPLVYFGLIFAFTRGVIGFFSPLRFKIEQKLGERGSFYGITIIFALMFLLMTFVIHPIGVAFLFLLFFTRDYAWTILDKYANDHIPSDKRATVLSIMNFGLNVVYIFVALLVGYGMDHLTLFGLNSLRSVLLVLGGFSGLIILPFLYLSYQKNNTSSKGA